MNPTPSVQLLRDQSHGGFLYRLTEKYIDGNVFLVDAGGYSTALSRHDLSGRLDYRIRNNIEKWF